MLFEGLAKIAEAPGATPPNAPKLGPIERKFDDWAKEWLGANSAAYRHYTANRNLWNIALPVATLGGTAMLTNAAANAFNGGGNNQGGGGGSNWASWLLPLGIVGGGLWAWNKFGDRISKSFGAAEKTPGKINQAAGAVTNTMRSSQELIDHLKKKTVPKIEKTVDDTRRGVNEGGRRVRGGFIAQTVSAINGDYIGEAERRANRDAERSRKANIDEINQARGVKPTTPSQSDPEEMRRAHDTAVESAQSLSWLDAMKDLWRKPFWKD